MGLIVLTNWIKKPIEIQLYRLFLWASFAVVVLCIESQLANPACAFENVSIKKYQNQATKIDNPVDLTRLPLNKTFQVNSPDFVLQFFFSGPDLLGIVFKRDLDKALFVKWCFFRNCEPSPFDYVSVIAQPHAPPLANGFFETKFPPGLNYHFQGLSFFTRN